MSVLLTGATGFLGAYLARDLLARSSAVIHCMVRPATSVSARERLRSHLLAHGVDTAVFDSRVRVVEGDLTHPQFGCSEARTRERARRRRHEEEDPSTPPKGSQTFVRTPQHRTPNA